MKDLAGVNPPIITIFDKDGKLDMPANYKLADFLIEKGVNGLAYLGTSGEFSLLTMDEKKQFIRDMTKYVNHRVNVIIGAGDTCLQNVLEIVKVAEEAGADGFLMVNPYFNVYAEPMVEAYYDKVAEETKLPIILYNFPGLTGFCMNTDFVKRLVTKHENIVGIKETTPDMEHLRDMLKVKEIRPDFRIFVAFENQAAVMLPLGTDGFIGATVNFAPEFTVGAYQAAKAGDMAKMVDYTVKMNLAMDVYNCSAPLFLACKEAVYQRVLGDDNHAERLPALPLSAEKKAQVNKVLKNLNLL